VTFAWPYHKRVVEDAAWVVQELPHCRRRRPGNRRSAAARSFRLEAAAQV